jgi:hypothetical protein
MSNVFSLKSILLIAANPREAASLRLQEEEREIKERLRLAGYGKAHINSIGSTRTRDIQQAMVDFKPQIVHFSGHGEGQNGLAFEDMAGQKKLVSSEALADLFKLFSDCVECVVLNACYSTVQAEEISRHIAHVVGMGYSIGDRSAIEFSVGFYTALGAGESIEFAYRLGCNSIQLTGTSEQFIPVLHLREQENILLPLPVNQSTDSLLSPKEDTKNDEKEPLTVVRDFFKISRIGGTSLVITLAIYHVGKWIFFKPSIPPASVEPLPETLDPSVLTVSLSALFVLGGGLVVRKLIINLYDGENWGLTIFGTATVGAILVNLKGSLPNEVFLTLYGYFLLIGCFGGFLTAATLPSNIPYEGPSILLQTIGLGIFGLYFLALF